MADAAGLTVRTIQKVESGRHSPEFQTLRSIARAIGFDMAVFNKPTPDQEKRQQEEMKRALRQTALVPTSPIRKADDALALAASISEWMDDLDGIWEISTASQRLDYASSIAALCQELEALDYPTHFCSFRQQHMRDKGAL